MKAIAITFAALLCTAAPSSGQDPATEPKPEPKKKEPVRYSVGSTIAADLVLTDIDGKEILMKDLRGKVVVLHFWSITCPALKTAEPKLIQITKDYADKDVVVLAVNSNQGEIGPDPRTQKETPRTDEGDKDGEKAEPKETYAKIRAHVKKAGVPFRITVDHGNKISDLFQARTTPHLFVVDQKGVLRFEGALDDDPRNQKGKDARNFVVEAVGALLAGEEVKTTSVKPYG